VIVLDTNVVSEFLRPAAARAYAAIAANRRIAGRPISQFDCQIAAIARVHEASVATRNTRDYEGCGIMVIDPWRPTGGR
jgi:toxin FitB